MEFRSAGSLEEALDLLGQFGPDAALLAGGTDLMLQLRGGEIAPRVLLHIERLADLRRLAPGEAPAIGALATHVTLSRSPVLRAHHAAICTAAASVGGWQTQSVGTIAGNLCNASPAADLAPPLLVHGATVRLASRARGERSLPLEQFLIGRRKLARHPDELVLGFALEPLPQRSADRYVKVGRRGAMEVAIAGVAVRLTLAADDKTIAEARIATCAVGPVPARAPDVERALKGQLLSEETVRAAGQMLSAVIEPIDDVRASARYRRAVVARVLVDSIQKCAASIRGAERQD